ncbi:tyrosine-type recombinase/integrase [Elizabethkingia anophelis]|uniref:tyrosine-type recombinase/integrase n=1 Tax=Elizabethkingia anophelis TaxID=1117645 RepID=UPI00162864E5|nr:integrase [Elizabethkingia anophelis]MCT4323839.1 integrase [Elizabethkingia anophelis]HAY3536581.1 site-specific integrase [Elizabethkingia anophelis]HAY3548697.1 site-specific integrase [Elizabethkingia anophelis]HAY3592462.1 site-specific integrase [Elizabethkingia anophelis]
MATIRFFLRGKEQIQKIYFRYRPNKQFDLVLATPYEINIDNWDNENQQWNLNQYTKGAKTTEKKKLNTEIERLNNNLNSFRIEISNSIDNNLSLTAPELKEHIRDYVKRNYFGHRINTQVKNSKPERFSELMDFYINFRSVEDKTKGTAPLAENTIKKYKTLQKVVSDFDRNLKVTEINDLFRNNFVDHLNKLNYSTNTQVKYIKDIKMLCKFADTDYPISREVLNWKINSNIENVAEYVTFSFEQLKKIKNTILPNDYLDNARDWLLISCYTSVRVSEIFTFDEDNIVEDNNNKFLKVIEKKNRNTKEGGQKYIYLLPEVLDIMEKRNGKFPRKISEQRYNGYIKKVCQIAGLTEIIEGGITEVKNNIKRKVKVKDEFWKLVTSHSGRATYVTLFSQYLPSEIIQMQTNHHSKEMVEHYNKTDLNEVLLQRARVVAQAHKEVELKIS